MRREVKVWWKQALYIHEFKKSEPTHSLIYLGKSLGVPKELEAILRDLTPDFVISRYPDVAQEVSYELYDQDIAKKKA
ncbi:hypothetical protein DRO97_09155 [Archaeoglobales archaeon]|nr:MAG: hypothetical protein DRO97_09155 [Archaeoglobales archaeon]